MIIRAARDKPTVEAAGPGLVLATPLTAALFVLVRELYIRDVLRDLEA